MDCRLGSRVISAWGLLCEVTALRLSMFLRNAQLGKAGDTDVHACAQMCMGKERETQESYP